MKAIESRRSIRKFKRGEAVTREQLDGLLKAAMLAPSAHNTRPWEFIVITNREVLDSVPEIHPWAGMCKTASAAIIMTVKVPEGKNSRGEELPTNYFPQCCAAATQNILIKARDLGLDTCWCGIYPVDGLIEAFTKKFEIEKPAMPFCIIAVGIADESPEPRGFFEESKVRYIT